MNASASALLKQGVSHQQIKKLSAKTVQAELDKVDARAEPEVMEVLTAPASPGEEEEDDAIEGCRLRC